MGIRLGCIGLLGLLAGCALWRAGAVPGANLQAATTELAQAVARETNGETIALLPWRDAKGERSGYTEAVDDYIISALLKADVPIVLADEKSIGKWKDAEPVPAKAWRDLSAERIVGGRLQEDAEWTYLRFFLIDRVDQALVTTHTWRLPQAELERQVAAQGQLGQGGIGQTEIAVDFHLLGLRDQGGFPEAVVVEEGKGLLAGDRVQIRFTPLIDCEVYAFLYSSEGARIDVLSPRYVYGGREQFGPGEEQWIDLSEAGQVYTLYFLAASRLDENREELFEEMKRLVDEGEINRFSGLEQLDELLGAYLLKGIEGEGEVAVIRGREDIKLGKKQSFILNDGTPIDSRAEELIGAPGLVRAISFEIQ